MLLSSEGMINASGFSRKKIVAQTMGCRQDGMSRSAHFRLSRGKANYCVPAEIRQFGCKKTASAHHAVAFFCSDTYSNPRWHTFVAAPALATYGDVS